MKVIKSRDGQEYYNFTREEKSRQNRCPRSNTWKEHMDTILRKQAL